MVWDYGDNSTPGAGTTTSHEYKDPGVYYPSLFLKDSQHNVATDFIAITVYTNTGPTSK